MTNCHPNCDSNNPYGRGLSGPPMQQEPNRTPFAQPQYGDYGAQGNAQQPYAQPQYGQYARGSGQQYGQPDYTQNMSNYAPYGQCNQSQYGNGYSPEPTTWNGLCIAGFVCSFLVPIVGLILSIIALTQINRTGEKSRGMAIAGIVISVVIWLFSFIFMASGNSIFF
ncbi:putative membrane protein [Bifidobacterium animalis subsp. lactis AD011]|uniref:Putative membrane protein n=3 Tax=Bifidobacterium animalis TaxID=28025 RepID=B8DWA8_BIFA0|nr:putative membrane protein [Bifidobacterium animalis subsp. lactis AD011]